MGASLDEPLKPSFGSEVTAPETGREVIFTPPLKRASRYFGRAVGGTYPVSPICSPE